MNNPWPIGSENWRLAEEMKAHEAKKRESRARQLLDRIMREIRQQSTTTECPCCCGRGRLEILLGARDDEDRR